MKKRIALLSLIAIFTFAITMNAQETNNKTTEPVKKEVKAEKKDDCNKKAEKKDEKKGCCKEETKKSDCSKK
ncbi:MAG: hypothetical protein Q7U47_02790 [Paludibacter sp.]|nr:hypothetical protein [Paludibacter sp.]